MTSTLMERTRALHEEVERYERLVAKDFHTESKSHRSRLSQNHRVAECVVGIQKQSEALLEIYKDEDKSRKEEIASMAGDNVFSIFYDRLKDVRDYHRRHPGLEVASVEEEEARYLTSQPKVDFSGEEGYGKFLDLHEFHRKFQNAKFGQKGISYLEFLEIFSTFGDVASVSKLNGEAYGTYLQELLDYLHGFYKKAQPLACLNDPLSDVERDFVQKWERSEVEGWEDKGLGTSSARLEGNPSLIDLEAFETSSDLEASLGADRIKEALVAMGLKAGGTPGQKAERLMKTKGKTLEELDPKLFAKGKAPVKNEREAQRRLKMAESVALLECKIQTLVDLLEATVRDTKSQVEKKATSTYEELVAEMEDNEEGLEDPAAAAAGMDLDGDDDDEDIIYNPLKLPLGWDGKPIPYWLYKLHGLNQEFKCEICGNYSYWGNRAFERHFKEFRHQHGLKCLGIPNNKVFWGVTKIDDALALWKSLQEKQQTGFSNDQDEEFEDKDGNVYNKKTYMDLQRQGLL